MALCVYVIIGLIRASIAEIEISRCGEKDEYLKDFDSTTAMLLDVASFTTLTLAWPIFVVKHIIMFIRSIRIVVEKEEP